MGERLIGRAPIALGELAKNSYDADADTCLMTFGDDEIVISDNGNGMSQADFEAHWLRLGTTHKVDAQYSPGGRLLTGSKGIGRLSVQFLASEMTLESTSLDNVGSSLYAIVDWSTIVRGNDLSSVDVAWEIRPGTPTYPNQFPTGTRISLRRPKNVWDADAFEELGREVWTLRSPFRRPPKRVAGKRSNDFEIEIEAPAITDALASFNRVQAILFDDWRARIRGKLNDGRRGGSASLVVEFREDYPDGAASAKTVRERVSVPVIRDDERNAQTPRPLLDKAEFEILIFKTEGRQPGGISVGDLREYLARFGNVSVYDAGFRLPYYGSGDAGGEDWLSIALDHSRRLNQSELLPPQLRVQNKYMQFLPAPGRILGAVDISTNHERSVAAQLKAPPGEWLQIQSGRDRLHDNDAFKQLRNLVRFALDYYANRYRLRALEAVERERDTEPPSEKYERVLNLLDENRDEIPKPVFSELKREVADAKRAARVEERAIGRRAAMFGPLATAGIMALALNHELSREVRALASIATKIRNLAKTHGLPDLEAAATEFDAARGRLHALRTLFSPLGSPEDNEASGRLRVRAIAQQVIDGMKVLMPGTDFDLKGIHPDLRFPLGSFTEWSAVLQNLFANSWNAMLQTRQSLISLRGARDKNGREWLHISDTGVGLEVSIPQSEKLFEPFERRLELPRDKRSLAIGGQGLGLAIVRMIAARRGAQASFVEPQAGFSTTVEISWKGVRQ